MIFMDSSCSIFSRQAGDVLSAGDYDVSGLADANHNLDKLQIALRVAERI
ncbi:MAG: hypothetical protein PUD38_00635 [Firmicutes bacterium]|nr:hypothetical protein [Bacillota bacterium]